MSLILIDAGGAEGGPPSTAPPGSTPPVTQRSGVPPTTPSQGFTYPSQTQMMFEDEDSFETGSSSGASQPPPPSGTAPVAANAISTHADQVSLTEFVGDDLYCFGDSLPANAAAFLSYVLAGSTDDWDESGTRVHVQRIGDLFRYVGAVTIDDGISPLTMQMLFDEDPVVTWDDTQRYAITSAAEQEHMERAAAQEIIDFVVFQASHFEIDLGDVRGLTAQEVVTLYYERLRDQWVALTLRQEREAMQDVTPDEIQDLMEGWFPIAFSFDAPPEITLDVLRWADDNIAGGHHGFASAQALSDTVRSYLLDRIAYFAIDPGTMDLQRASLNELAALFEQEYLRRSQHNSAVEGSYFAAGGRDMTAYYASGQSAVPENSPWYPVHLSERSLDDFQRFGGTRIGSLTDALNNNYTSPPDLTLLLLVGSILIEPLDWVVTGVEIIGDLARGDFGSAAANTALAVLPIAGGWMDDIGGLRHAPDDPPGGGGLASGADEAADAARQAARASNTPLSQTAPAGVIGSADAQIANASVWRVGAGNEFYDELLEVRRSMSNPDNFAGNMAVARVRIVDANGQVVSEIQLAASSGRANSLTRTNTERLLGVHFGSSTDVSTLRLEDLHFTYQNSVPPSLGETGRRTRTPESTRTDSEAIILEDLYRQVSTGTISIPPGSVLEIDLYTELIPCASCGGDPVLQSDPNVQERSVMEQFLSDPALASYEIQLRVQWGFNDFSVRSSTVR